jgi:hypothetical protein
METNKFRKSFESDGRRAMVVVAPRWLFPVRRSSFFLVIHLLGFKKKSMWGRQWSEVECD